MTVWLSLLAVVVAIAAWMWGYVVGYGDGLAEDYEIDLGDRP